MGIDLAAIDSSNRQAGLYPQPQPPTPVPAAPPTTPQGILANAADALAEGFKRDPVVRYLGGVGQTFRSLAEGDTQMVDKDELSKTYGAKIPYDMTHTEAAMYSAQQQDAQIREERLAQFKMQHPVGGMADYALEFVGGMAAPENIAAFGVPVIKFPAGASTLGQVGMRAAEGGVNVAAFTAAMQPLSASQDIAEGRDYTAKDFMTNVAYGGLQGLVAGGVLSGLGKVFAGLSNESKAAVNKFNIETGGQLSPETAIGLTPEAIYKDAGELGINPHELANARAGDVINQLKANDAPEVQNLKPIEPIEPKETVENGAPNKAELFDKYMDKAKAMKNSIQIGIDCILRSLNA